MTFDGHPKGIFMSLRGRKRIGSMMRSFASMLRGSAMGLLPVMALVSCTAPASKDHAASGAASSTAQVAAVKEPETDSTPRHLRLVTGDQYVNTLAYVFG